MDKLRVQLPRIMRALPYLNKKRLRTVLFLGTVALIGAYHLPAFTVLILAICGLIIGGVALVVWIAPTWIDRVSIFGGGVAVSVMLSILLLAHAWPMFLVLVALVLYLIALIQMSLWVHHEFYLGSEKWTPQESQDRRVAENDRYMGLASVWDVIEFCGVGAMRLLIPRLRPSLMGQKNVPPTTVSTLVLRVGMKFGGIPWKRAGMYVSARTGILRMGGPEGGKSVAMAAAILDHDGPVYTTSTRVDILNITGPTRARKGLVHVYNPGGLHYAIPMPSTEEVAPAAWWKFWLRWTPKRPPEVVSALLESTIRWTPLVGCKDFAVALRRGIALIPATQSADRQFWQDGARNFLAIMMHAAALGGYDLRTVARWITAAHASPEVRNGNVQDPEAKRAMATIRDCLSRSDSPVEMDVDELFTTTIKTRQGFTTAMKQALAWLNLELAARCGDCPVADANLLDTDDFLRSLERADTIYVLGGGRGSEVVGPLIACLTEEINDRARLIANGMPNNRLDPSLRLALDECAIACPVDLAPMTADSGGFGIVLDLAVQSPSDLTSRWGEIEMLRIINNSKTKIVHGGLVGQDAELMSKIANTRIRDGEGDSTRDVAGCSPADLHEIPPLSAAVFHAGMRWITGKVPVYWEHPSYKANAGTWNPQVNVAYAPQPEIVFDETMFETQEQDPVN